MKLLTGANYWYITQDAGGTYPPPAFDFDTWLSTAVSNGYTCVKSFLWEQGWQTEESNRTWWITPNAYSRPGPGNALDGLSKYDLSTFNQGFFDRIRERAIALRDAGIYVSFALFCGFSVMDKGYPAGTSQSPWEGHPFHISNNINSVNGDPGSNGDGRQVHTLDNAAVTALQEAYIEKMVDTLNDLDNVMFEIALEPDATVTGEIAWQAHMIDYLHTYEATKPKQHPVGYTPEWPGGSTARYFASEADWISPSSDLGYGSNDPPDPSGTKVLINDTDHNGMWPEGDRTWAWETFLRGAGGVWFMDGYTTEYGEWCVITPSDSKYVTLRANLGYIAYYANTKVDLLNMTPQGSLCSTGFCLAKPHASAAHYLAYQDGSGAFTLDLSGSSGTLQVEWLNPAEGFISNGGTVAGGAVRTLTPPFSGDAVVWVRH